MPDINWGNYGVAGIAIAVLFVSIIKLPDIITAVKSNKKDEASGNGKSEKGFAAILENNTAAIVELTQFLRTQAEVDKEKEKQSNKVLDSMDTKLTRILELQTEHMAKCETKCIH